MTDKCINCKHSECKRYDKIYCMLLEGWKIFDEVCEHHEMEMEDEE